MDEVYKLLKDDTEIVEKLDQGSVIRNFYTDQIIFITDPTSLLGEIIVEKLLRCCSQLKKLYILFKDTGGMTVQDEMKKYFESSAFDTLRNKIPDFYDKIVPIKGNLLAEDIALSGNDKNDIIDNVNFIIHNASANQFGDTVKSILQLNVLGTKRILDIAKDCENLKTFVYVSSVYAHCNEIDIKEKLYPCSADLKIIHDMIAADTENKNGLSKAALEMILGDYPDAYTFSKAIAEFIIDECSKKSNFRSVIFRPSLELPSYKEPIAGWCHKDKGPISGFIGITLGAIHTIWAQDKAIDFIPSDMCGNALLASIWDASFTGEKHEEAIVYNYGSSMVKPVTLRKITNLLENAASDRPSMKMICANYTVITKCYWLWFLLNVMIHVVPAAIVDGFSLLRSKEPTALTSYCEATRNLESVQYFLNGEWRVHVEKMQQLCDRMSETDSTLFYCDIRKFRWEDYADPFWNGLRVYAIDDPMDSLIEAKQQFYKLRIRHYISLSAVLIFISYIIIQFI
ncbi:fatty acyl-CoA reductase wat [Cephus cinctus]|uniref:Fatty acyl-CoA reductase n=1 Tax=Cephus cinctus TaxID=211228 RepID=A0AAJ7BZF3_CEPCN|nr:fatty acyl-CoA reductase wat [Cephus cinctus]